MRSFMASNRYYVSQKHQGQFESFLASKIASLSLFNPSSTAASLSKLKDALTYGVFPPLGMKTVPGNAMTPFSIAFVLIMSSESPSSSSSSSRELSEAPSCGLKMSLNLEAHEPSM